MSELYLSDTALQSFKSCALRRFDKCEHHVTRRFKYSVLILMLSGKLCFTEEGQDIELTGNEYYIQRQGLYQEGRMPSDAPEYFYIHFDGAFSKGGGLPLRGNFPLPQVMEYLRILEQSVMSNNANDFALNGIFYSILGCLGRECENSKTDYIAAEIARYLAEHFTERGFSTDSITERFPYNKDYLIRLFKDKFSVTPYKYITKLRIERASQLLLSSTKTAEEIAHECGYEDYSVFYKNFFKLNGCSPLEWIRRHLFCCKER